jgi:C4-dicarboxylate-specific signal transduction histidine kinase
MRASGKGQAEAWLRTRRVLPVAAAALMANVFMSASLPNGTSAIFEPASFWEQNRTIVVLALVALAALLGLITSLAFYFALKSRREKTEKELIDSENIVAFAAASTNSGFWKITELDQPLVATASCAELFWLPKNRAYRIDELSKAVHAEDRQVFLRMIGSAVRRALPLDFRFRVCDHAGNIRWIAAKAHAARPENGGQTVVTGLFTDVTQLKQLEDERELQRREVTHLMRQSVVNELSGSIAHELNQPLTAIMSNAEAAMDWLGQKNLSVEAVRESLEDIVEDAARASEVICRVRRLIKKEDGKKEIIDIEKLFESTHGLLRSESVRRKISIDVDYASVLPPVRGDFVQLQQVLINVVMNSMEAIKPTPERVPKIALSAKSHGDNVRIVVSDNGPGIATEVANRLFEPFVTTKSQGLGLGLSICATIAESHGGSILIENNPDGGATAVLTLPVRHAQGAMQ